MEHKRYMELEKAIEKGRYRKKISASITQIIIGVIMLGALLYIAFTTATYIQPTNPKTVNQSLGISNLTYNKTFQTLYNNQTAQLIYLIKTRTLAANSYFISIAIILILLLIAGELFILSGLSKPNLSEADIREILTESGYKEIEIEQYIKSK